jgi:hypothetical protein
MATASARALEIAERLGASTYQLRALWGLAGERYVSGDYATALAFTEQFGRVVQDTGDQSAGLVHDRMMALALHLAGRQSQARSYAECALAHPAAAIRTAHKTFNEIDSRVASRSHLARILWVQGYPDRAAAMANEGVEIASMLGFAPPLCYVLVFAACPIAFWTGNLAAAQRHVELLLEQSHDRFGYWHSWGRCYEQALLLGSAEADPQFARRVATIREAARGPVSLDILGTLREELVGSETVARAESGRAEWCAAEILRAHAVLLMRQFGNATVPRAEALLLQSLDIAGHQEAHAWVLRTSTSLAGLWHGQGKTAAARDLLADSYNWFSEGLATADLSRASFLLKSMGN